MELLTLTTPTPVTTYRVTALELHWTRAYIRVQLISSLGVAFKAEYTGTEATNLMVGLNKANLSTNSLHKRILERLATDGKLPAGTVTGSPD
jgi:hypothetical protein